MLNYAAGTPTTGYNLTRSLRFRASASANMVRTPASAGNRQKFTYSGWVKRGNLVGGSFNTLISTNEASSPWATINFDGNEIQVSFTAGIALGTFTNAVFRDPSAWYHIVVAVDTTQATAANRIQIYVNGVLQSIRSANYPALNANTQFNDTVIHRIGGYSGAFFDGYMAEINWIDGQALTPSSFGSTNALTGVWQPAPYTGTYGTNGFYLPFTDNSALTTSSNVGLGRDYSGNGNYWTTNNISITAGVTYDSMTDVPTLTNATTANYCVFNPLDVSYGAPLLSNANLRVSYSASGRALGTIFVSSGKWYAEFTMTQISAGNADAVGISGVGTTNSMLRAYTQDGTYFNGTAWTAYGSSFTNGDVIGVAYDPAAQTLEFFKNNTSQGVKTSVGISTATFVTWVQGASGNNISANFGQRPFAYTPPTGFVALNTFNLPTATVLDGSDYMDAATYTGDGNLTRTLTGLYEFQPDLIWAKNRGGAFSHVLQDSVRGFSSTRKLSSNTSDAENSSGNATDPGFGYISAVSSTGFSVATTGGGITQLNQGTAGYVAWAWKANGAAVSNTNGSITSQVSANTSAGFSVVTYTGTGANATVGHGLGVAPKMFFVKRRNTTESWAVYHNNLSTAANCLLLNLTNAQTSAPAVFNSTAPTSSVFSIGTDTATNASGSTYVAYCWSEIEGFSKFGVYTGNSNADGPFIYLGFRPKFIMFKGKTFANNWYIIDSSTNTINVAGAGLKPNAADAEIATSTTENAVDFLSNGFKLRNNAASVAFNNSSGQEFVYAAFAENPFKNSLAR
jgi:hypothetical protein